MRLLAALLIVASCSCAPLVRSDDETADAGTPSFSVLEINGFLVPPGTPIAISGAPIATSTKWYVRKTDGNAPDCWYGVFIADPAAQGEPNNGVLLTALGDMNKINNDSTLGGASRTDCPDPSDYLVGGAIPDGVQIGDLIAVEGYFEPYCDDYNTSEGECEYDLFPEVTPDPPTGYSEGTVQDNGAGTQISPMVVAPTDISDLAAGAIEYAAELLTVQQVNVSNAPLDGFGDVVLNQGALWLNALVPTTTIVDAAGTAYCSITGDLHFQYGHWKLRPREQSDLVLCPAGSDGGCDYSLCPGG